MSDENQFRFSQEIQIRWMDLDPLGHVNNAIYIVYFEMGRSKYMITASDTWDWHKNMFLIANVNCDYKRELKMADKHPHVHARMVKFGTKSFELEYAITSGENHEVLHATGKSIQVMFDTNNKTTVEIPDWLKKEIRDFEK
jgi:acyl-CoA thioester hydrolase